MKYVTMTRASGIRSFPRLAAHAVLWCVAVCCPALAQDIQPTAPADFEASAAVTEVDLSWAASGDATALLEYEVESCAGAECSDFVLAGATESTVATDSGLAPGSTHRYRVRAVDAQGHYSPYSSVRTITTNLDVPTGAVIRVNVGGDVYVDAAGNTWEADRGFSGGLFTTVAPTISGTPDSLLYQSLRYTNGDPSLDYAFDIPAGEYLVKLHFAEIFPGVFFEGGRVFNVEVEGQTAISGLDVFAEAGAYTALVEEVPTTVSDGQLNIRFMRGVQEPFVSAIEVIAVATPDTTAPGAVANLTINRVSNTELDLDWDDATDDTAVVGYSIERCTFAACSNFSELTTVDAPPFSDTGLVCETTYRYRVRAFDEAGNFGAYSEIVTSPNCQQCNGHRHHRHHHWGHGRSHKHGKHGSRDHHHHRGRW